MKHATANRWRLSVAWGAVVVLLMASMPGVAGSLSLPAQGALDLADALEYWEDPHGTLDVTAVREMASSLQRHEGGVFNRGMNSSTWWLRVSVANPYPQSLERLLHLPHPQLAQAEVFAFAGEAKRAHYRLGIDRPYRTRPINHPDHIVPLVWEPGETLEVYVRIVSRDIVRVPLLVWDRTALMSHLNIAHAVDGLLLGALLGLAIYNLLLFLVTRQRSHLYYVGMMLCILLTLATLRGLAFRYLWPELPGWNARALPVFLNATLLFTVLFAQRFLRIGTASPYWVRILQGILALFAASVLASLVLPHSVAIRLAIGNAVIAVPLFVICSVHGWIRGVTAARYATAAALTMLVATPMFVVDVGDLAAMPGIANYSLHIGFSVAALMLSFGLAARINHDRQLRLEAQAQALRATEAANIELQKRVAARTREQEALAEQLHRLSITDPLTGLANRRHFDQRLAARWSLIGTRLAVVLIDIDHFKDINDTYGHAAGDVCLREVARRITENVYFPNDDAARYGGEEFALSLPDTDASGAQVVTERIRQAVAQRPIHFGEHAINLTVSAGIAAGVSNPNTRPEELVIAADRALYASKRNGRDRVSVASESMESVS